MNLQKDKYIIVEIIPTHSNSDKGFIAQISALKLDGIKLLDRFDYRINNDLIDNEDIKNMISYDKDMFTYLDDTNKIIDMFKNWSEDYPLLLLDNSYTMDYFKDINNSKEIIYPYLNMEYNNEIFNQIINKYKLEPSNHLVDLLYEAIIYEGNNK